MEHVQKSQASVTDLNKEFDKARSTQQRSGPGSTVDPANILRDLFFSIPGGSGNELSREMDSVERIRAGPQQGGKRPQDLSPQELHSVLWQVLTFRDSVAKKIEKTIERIPGLGPLIEKIMDSVSVFVFTTLEPFVKPLLQTATSSLSSVSGEVINNQDQYEVFNDPRASDPTHSFLSKDHFNLILNEPAGHLAKIIVTYTVTLVVKAWDDNSMNVRSITDDTLSCLFHPDFHNRSSKIQGEMMQYMQHWVQQLGSKQHSTLSRLTKDAVRNHQNVRLGGDGGPAEAQGTFAYSQGQQVQHNIQAYATNHIPGVAQAQSLFNKFEGGNRREGPGTSIPTSHHHSYHPPSGPQPPASGDSIPTSHHQSYHPPSGPPPPASGDSIPTSHNQSYHLPSGPPPPASGESTSYYGSSAHYVPPPGPPPGGYYPYSSPPSLPDAYPGTPSQFPETGGYSGGHQHYAPPQGPPPPGAPGGFASPGGPPGPSFPQTAPHMPGDGSGFPGAEPYNHQAPAPQFPNAAQFPPGGGFNPYGNSGW
jgi:hypothetical protein